MGNCSRFTAWAFTTAAIATLSPALAANEPALSRFSIPAQPLSTALVELSKQANIQVLTAGYEVEGLIAQSVSGELTLEAALKQLLRGSGFSYRFVDSQTLVLIRQRSTATRSKGTRTVLAAVSALAVGTAQAEERPKIEEVIVTATRNEAAAQTVPVSLTALSTQAIQEQAIQSVADLQTAVPGLLVAVNSQGGSPTFAIRAAKADNGTSDTVTVYVDDTPVAGTRSVAKMVYDMQSISTLKGPQGTLFGANSTGGAIIFRPNKPTEEFEGYAELGTGNWGRKYVQGMVNLPVNDVLQVRIAGDLLKRDGFVENHTPGGVSELNNEDYYSGRISVRLRPNGALLNDLVADYYHEDAQPSQAILVAIREPNYAFQNVSGGAARFLVDWSSVGVQPASNPWNVSIGPSPIWSEHEFWGVGNTTTYQFTDRITFKNVLGYRHDDSDTFEDNDGTINNAPNGRTVHIRKQRTWEPSVDFASENDRLRSKLGLFFSKLEIDTGNAYRTLELGDFVNELAGSGAGTPGPFAAASFPVQSNALYYREFKSKAIYGNVSYDVTEDLTATLGMRYTKDEGEYRASVRRLSGLANNRANSNAYGDFSFGNCFIDPPGAGVGLETYDEGFDAAKCIGGRSFDSESRSYTFTLDYQIHPETMLYFTHRAGYLIGGFNNQVFTSTGEGQTFKPEKVLDFESGLKSDWELAGRPIRTNVAAFYGRYRDQQRVQNSITADGVTYVSVTNAGSSTFYGLDMDVSYYINDNLRASLGWNHIIAEYDEFKAPLATPGLNAFVDLAGTQMSQTPKNVINLSATYQWPLSTDVGDISSTLSYFWRSDTTAKDAPAVIGPVVNGEVTDFVQDFREFDRLESYHLVNFTTEWKRILRSNFSLDVWVKNVFDKEYAIYSNNQLPHPNSWATRNYGNPREIGLNARYDF